MKVLITRLPANGMPSRDLVWTTRDDGQPMFAFHAHVKDTVLAYEARPLDAPDPQ